MDEPSAALSRHGHRAPARGRPRAGRCRCTVLLISHFLSEVLELADTVSVLRDGRRWSRTGPAAEETEASLIEAMLGRSLGSVFPDKPPEPAAGAEAVLTVDALPRARRAGREPRGPPRRDRRARRARRRRPHRARAPSSAPTALARGTMQLAGAPADLPRRPRSALRRRAFCIPESRKDSGLLLNRSVTENITLARLEQLHSLRLARRRSARRRRASRELDDRSARASAPRRRDSPAATSRSCSSRGACCATRAADRRRAHPRGRRRGPPTRSTT